jgi:Cytochrome c7 and related cytochrome c/Class III cytochrome C family
MRLTRPVRPVSVFLPVVLVCGLASSCGGRPSAAAQVFTPAHQAAGEAVREFFAIRATAVQPIPFPHRIHIEKKAECVDCHESVDKGPVAGIPSVKTCMICHSQLATDRPLIRQVAEYSARGIEIPWQRVYGFTAAAHVRFDHAPHVRADVGCAPCHGDLGTQTVAVRSVNHNMGFCVSCHRQRQVSNDCLTCHY